MGPNNQMIGLAPLYPGTNDLDKLAARWAKETGFEKSGAAKIESAGKPRDAVMFTKTQNGIMFAQIAVLYIEPDYRLVVMYQAPATLLAQDGAEAWLQAFFKNNVVMP
jgi:hypothetical protein